MCKVNFSNESRLSLVPFTFSVGGPSKTTRLLKQPSSPTLLTSNKLKLEQGAKNNLTLKNMRFHIS